MQKYYIDKEQHQKTELHFREKYPGVQGLNKDDLDLLAKFQWHFGKNSHWNI